MRCDRLRVPDAYIIDEIERKRGERRERSILILPPPPDFDFYDWLKQQEQDVIEDYRHRVIVIDL